MTQEELVSKHIQQWESFYLERDKAYQQMKAEFSRQEKPSDTKEDFADDDFLQKDKDRLIKLKQYEIDSFHNLWSGDGDKVAALKASQQRELEKQTHDNVFSDGLKDKPESLIENNAAVKKLMARQEKEIKELEKVTDSEWKKFEADWPEDRGWKSDIYDVSEVEMEANEFGQKLNRMQYDLLEQHAKERTVILNIDGNTTDNKVSVPDKNTKLSREQRNTLSEQAYNEIKREFQVIHAHYGQNNGKIPDGLDDWMHNKLSHHQDQWYGKAFQEEWVNERQQEGKSNYLLTRDEGKKFWHKPKEFYPDDKSDAATGIDNPKQKSSTRFFSFLKKSEVKDNQESKQVNKDAPDRDTEKDKA